jgi:hypothetical protein
VITEDDICNQLLDHWAEQNKPHLDDEDKCCYVLAVRAVNEIRRLRAELKALRADAERYRWLRNDAKNTDVTQPIVVRGYDGPAGNYFNEPLWDDELDAAIDAARKGE